MKQKLFLFLFSLAAYTAQAKDIVIKSPNGKLTVTVSDHSGQVSYSVSYDGKQMLTPSALGLNTNIGDFTKGLTFQEVKEQRIDRTYSMTRTKASSSHYVAQQTDITYTNGKGLPLTFFSADALNAVPGEFTASAFVL